MKTISTLCAFVILVGISTVLAHGQAVGQGNMQSRLDALEKQVQELQDRAAIEQLLMTYGRDLDNRDFSAYSQLFASNGDWSGNLNGKKVTYTGPAEIKAAMEKIFARPAGSPKGPANFHLLTNAIINVDGDHATAVSKWTFIMVMDRKPVINNAGHYDDTLVRENGQWKFLHRTAPSVLMP
jgi:SnoaL-like domain